MQHQNHPRKPCLRGRGGGGGSRQADGSFTHNMPGRKPEKESNHFSGRKNPNQNIWQADLSSYDLVCCMRARERHTHRERERERKRESCVRVFSGIGCPISLNCNHS
jgi:hypothetical protein